jgi:ankyrin repeat protein
MHSNQKIKELLKAALTGDFKTVRSFIEDQGVGVNSADSNDRTALHCAASKGHDSVVEYLLSKEATLDCETTSRSDGGITPLYSAVQYEHVSTATILLKEGAKTDTVVNGNTMLQVAAKINNLDMINLLLNHGVNINDNRGKDGTTALHTALLEGKNENANFLLEKGADYKQCAEKGYTPLNFAARKDHKGTEMLLKHIEERGGKEELQKYVNLSADNGHTALHIAASREDYEAVRVLLEHGADPRIKDNNQKKPCDIIRGLSAVPRQIKNLLSKAEEKLEGAGHSKQNIS